MSNTNISIFNLNIHIMSIKNLEHHKNKNIFKRQENTNLNLCENPEATTMQK